MGEIVESKSVKEKIVHDVLIDEREHLILGGHLNNIHYFSEGSCNCETSILRRGHKNGATYLKVPKTLKPNKKVAYSNIKSQKIEEDKKVYYIFTLDKMTSTGFEPATPRLRA